VQLPRPCYLAVAWVLPAGNRGRKHFFFEKKKQKTFDYIEHLIFKSFLLLFFKKEVLSLFAAAPNDQR
jgi:hypothetical protein